MAEKYKYDIAISVAEEEVFIAEQIGKALVPRGITYFLYTEYQALIWGEHILKVCLDAFAADVRYVLMITSCIYEDKYWSKIEGLIVDAFKKSRQPYVLQLRIGPSKIDLIRQHIAYQDWKNNPEEIADLIEIKVKERRLIEERREKLRKEKERKEELRRRRKRHLISALVTIILISIGFILIISSDKTEDPNISLSKTPIKVRVNSDTSFFISQTEVTIGQYSKYCSKYKKTMPPQKYPDQSYPVTNITWYQANAYCRSLGGRLPTESEWEYAAIGGSVSPYSGGTNASKVAIYRTYKPGKVGMRSPNGFDLYDMSGNVAEWCIDWYRNDSTSSSAQKAIRGGAYNSKIEQVKVFHHDKEFPDSARPYIGFRVAWDKEK